MKDELGGLRISMKICNKEKYVIKLIINFHDYKN